MWKISLGDLLQLGVNRDIAPLAPVPYSSLFFSSSSIVSLLGGASLSWEAVPGRLERPKANSGTFLG